MREDSDRRRQDAQDVPITADTPPSIQGRHLYAGEVRYADEEIARLLEGLAQRGVLDDTIVVFTADHGEAFDARHGAISHGFTVAEEVLRIPLIMRAPGLIPAGLRIDAVVALIDIVPTLLDLLGQPAPVVVQGHSLVPLLRDPADPFFAGRPVFSEAKFPGGFQVAARQGPFKWIVGKTEFSPEQMYRIVDDPTESHDLLVDDHHPSFEDGVRLVAQYREQALTLRRQVVAADDHTPALPDRRTVEKLRALGYTQ